MSGLLDKIKEKIGNLANAAIGNTLAQKENAQADGQALQVKKEHSETLLRAAAEGAVLLKNKGVLPLKGKITVFGRCQYDWFYTGYGSGGDVIAPYKRDLIKGLLDYGADIDRDTAELYRRLVKDNPAKHGVWGHWPRCHEEFMLPDAVYNAAADRSECAVVVIGRSSGEDRENLEKKGSYYLTDNEIILLDKVTERFKKTAVVFNIGSLIDFSFIEERYGDKIGAALIVWQGGMESGNAAAALLTGAISPSGRLSDTVAVKYGYYPSAPFFGAKKRNFYSEDIYVGYRYFETFYKDRVLYPFGYGLSYTTFENSFVFSKIDDYNAVLKYKVKNTGKYASKQVIQVYVKKPAGFLNKPARELVAFKKTGEIAPGAEEEGEIALNLQYAACFDGEGKTEFPFRFVLEKGIYEFFAGENVREAVKAGEWEVPKTLAVSEESRCATAESAFSVLDDDNGKPVFRRLEEKPFNLKDYIERNLPPKIPQTGDKGFKLKDVKNGTITAEEFVAQLSVEELEALSRGEGGMDSPLGPKGNAGVFGGVLPSLREKGIPPVTTTDGPSGIRLKAQCSLIPTGTLLACTFNTELVEEVFALIGNEMKERKSDVLLAPGMNIHRNPLCGRNFEYYSEDPLLTGKTGAAAVRGLQSAGVAACPKHFACNNQEYNRNKNDSAVSSRALREIYLKGFEICVKESRPLCIMTSYNKINGVWAHYNYELCSIVLRKEWGFDGLIMTDWWMQPSKMPEYPALKNNAYRIRAGVNLLMPGGKSFFNKKADGSALRVSDASATLTVAELQRNAVFVLDAVMRSGAFGRDD